MVVRPINWALEWPIFLSVVLELAPLAAGLLARRVLREPAMRIAALWSVFALVDIWMGARYHGLIAVRFPVERLILPLHVLLLTPAMLAWAGGTLARRRHVVTAVFLAAIVVPMLWLVDEREYRLYVQPLGMTLIGVFVLVALARTVRSARGPLLAEERFIICIALTVYLLISVLWPPLLETAFAINPSLGRAVNRGRLTLEMLAAAALAVAIHRGSRAPVPAPDVGRLRTA